MARAEACRGVTLRRNGHCHTELCGRRTGVRNDVAGGFGWALIGAKDRSVGNLEGQKCREGANEDELDQPRHSQNLARGPEFERGFDGVRVSRHGDRAAASRDREIEKAVHSLSVRRGAVTLVRNLLAFSLAAILEIGGCFAFWSWLRRGSTPMVAILGVASLIGFAVALTRVDAEFAGRAYAAYGGIYIVFSLLWLWIAEQQRPTRGDLIGSAFAISGTLWILFSALHSARR